MCVRACVIKLYLAMSSVTMLRLCVTNLYVASSLLLLLLLLLLCDKAVRACDKVVCDNVLCACDGVVCDRAKGVEEEEEEEEGEGRGRAQNGKTKAPHNYGGKRTIGFDIDNIFVNERGSPSPCHSLDRNTISRF